GTLSFLYVPQVENQSKDPPGNLRFGVFILAFRFCQKVIAPDGHFPAAMAFNDSSSIDDPIHLPKGELAAIFFSQLRKIRRLNIEEFRHGAFSARVSSMARGAVMLIFHLSSCDHFHFLRQRNVCYCASGRNQTKNKKDHEIGFQCCTPEVWMDKDWPSAAVSTFVSRQ
ncbi:MAG: hypothetical protein ACREQV_20005, partial [Candidatus Binatia bacterium]